MVILNKFGVDARCVAKGITVEAFKEESAVVAENPGFENEEIGNGGLDHFH
jgi:hypothetical protein